MYHDSQFGGKLQLLIELKLKAGALAVFPRTNPESKTIQNPNLNPDPKKGRTAL